LQNTDSLQEMFGDIFIDDSNHWNPMSNPIIPESQTEINNAQEDDEHEQGNPFFIGLIRKRFLLSLPIRKEKLTLS
jgi:hypothetical protein